MLFQHVKLTSRASMNAAGSVDVIGEGLIRWA
jgi:hypothetical protein